MQTHRDSDFEAPEAKLLERLKTEADRMTAAGENIITGGADGEQTVQDWQDVGGIYMRQLPVDPLGITRVSVGGLSDLQYCSFRGDPEEVIGLLNKTLNALIRRQRK